jgi:hypothetical protein
MIEGLLKSGLGSLKSRFGAATQTFSATKGLQQ